MNFSKIFIITVTLLFGSLSLINATPINELSDVTIQTEEVEGGPRDVVQTLIATTVYQPTATPLNITIRKSNGEAAIVVNTSSLITVISSVGLEAGSYTVETVDNLNDVQTFSITIE